MKLASPQAKTSHAKAGHRRSTAPPQHKAAMGRPYGLNHIAIGPADSGLEQQATTAAASVMRGERGVGRNLTAAPPAAVAIPSRGDALTAAQRAWLEPGFGADLGAVRVHHDDAATTAARAEHAAAFTAGRDIYFGAGQYDPQSAAGRSLLAHEVVHVLQQAAQTSDGILSAREAAGAGLVQRSHAGGAASAHRQTEPQREPSPAAASTLNPPSTPAPRPASAQTDTVERMQQRQRGSRP